MSEIDLKISNVEFESRDLLCHAAVVHQERAKGKLETAIIEKKQKQAKYKDHWKNFEWGTICYRYFAYEVRRIQYNIQLYMYE